MNIFALHESPEVSAEMACDKHVVKMILESAQLLCTVHRVLDGTEYTDLTKNGRKIKRWRLDNDIKENLLYKAGWLKHPSTVWLMQSAFNYNWLYRHMMALGDEYTKRYGKKHLTITKLEDVLRHPPKNAKLNVKGYDATPAMPEECKVPGDSVTSYRKYYIMKKARFATWKNRVPPKWFSEGLIKHLGGTISNGV